MNVDLFFLIFFLSLSHFFNLAFPLCLKSARGYFDTFCICTLTLPVYMDVSVHWL